MGPNKKMVLFESDIKRLEEVKSFILENLDKELTAAAIAAQHRIGKSTLHRHFSAFFNQSLHQFILKSRMEKVMELIVERHCNINQAGTLVGYKEASSLTRAFIKYYGHPPKYYIIEDRSPGSQMDKK
ncbi:helix-turn-helix transcriptional regulator [Mucilaginibacter boryungensis]|uniref:Helix-turn-helix transcriptional regulator n=1 Tax=Mucilaginibacter boryungensis TaxID=768480 RepID=A0ABR9XLN7_9SPHI|nr:AraC family transcriptional regulator [Mucilaginibacter boryungensis]MBE9668130.1 helix-turn-helix transcriptional regulator [Mucilaginibacter boryungensis]